MIGNNVQYKMREIVKQIREALLADSGMGPTTALHAKIDQLTQAALELPLRQCDAGTSDEQAERFENFCLKHIGCAEETGGRHCVGCPLEKASRNITQKCELYWAQMPYEEGGAS